MMKKLRRRTLNQSSDLLLSIGQVKWEYNEKERGKKAVDDEDERVVIADEQRGLFKV